MSASPNASPLDQNGNISLQSAVEYANANPQNGIWAFNHYTINLSEVGGQTITLNSTLVLNTNFDILSANGAVTITPPTGPNAPQFNHFDVTAGTESCFMNLELTNGTSAEAGGSIWNAGTAYFLDCTFMNNASAISGGAIATVTNGITTVEGCTFVCNSAASGGAIAALPNSTATNINNCTLTENTATGNGGAVYSDGAGTLAISSSSITDNWTTGGNSLGGGVYVDTTTTATISQTNITDNTSSWQGGGLYVFDTNLTMTGGALSNNTSAQDGGGFYIYALDFTVTLNQVSVTGNTATNGLGGGGYLNYGTLAGQLNAGQLTGNNAGANGPNGNLPGIGVSIGTSPSITVAPGQQTVEQNAIINGRLPPNTP